jgi:hypothetical protein
MTKAHIATVVTAVAAAACLAAGAALAAPDAVPKTYKFSATYAGKSVVALVDNNATIQSTAGVGTATAPVGKSKLSGAGKGVGGDPCGTFGGLGAITAVGGKLTISIAPTGGSACGDESGQTFTVSGRATVKGGTGKFAKAKGSFKFAGTFTRATGAFTVKFVGTLTV